MALLGPPTDLKGQKLSCAGRRKSQKTIKMALLDPATDLKGQKLSCAGRRNSQKTIKMALLASSTASSVSTRPHLTPNKADQHTDQLLYDLRRLLLRSSLLELKMSLACT